MKTTLLKKVLTFTLPVTIIPLVLGMIFYYMYVHKVLENDIIHFQKKILVHIITEVNELINDPLKLEHHLKNDHIALPEMTVFDKDMNIVVKNYEKNNRNEADQEYSREILEEHFTKMLQSKNDEIIHDEKISLLIKPLIENDKVIAYVTSGYKSTVDEKMVTINQTFLYLIFIIIFTAFVISIFVIIFSFKLLHPLELLIDGIKNITAGNLTFTIPNVSTDEIGIVVDAFNDMTLKRKLIEDELHESAIRDGLTGLYNHKFFYTKLEDEILRTARYKHPLSLLMLDIDHFKDVNDHYGHRAGDTILSALSQRLMTRIRDTDFVCRYGGEELTIILVETHINVAQSIAEELRRVIEKEPFLIEDGRYIHITVSIGVSTYSEEAKETSMIVSNADSALYRAKKSGRNQVCIYEKNNL